MYRIRTPNYRKRDQVVRWALPDRVFFACGACHILAYAFLQFYDVLDKKIVWLKPDPGFTDNHIFIQGEAWTFDYHGYSRPQAFLSHTYRKARPYWPGWGASLIELTPDVLISEVRSRAHDGLSLREPGQFLHDALPRARAYLTRFRCRRIKDHSASSRSTAQSINDVGTALISDVVARLARMRSLLIMMGDDRMSRR